MEKVEKVEQKNFIVSITKGTLIAISFSLVAIFIFALLIKFLNINDSVITPVNQVIKILSILFACFITFKKDRNKGLFKGLLIGLLYTVFAFLIFSALSRSFQLSYSLITDIIFGTLIGGLCGILGVNLRRN